MRDGARASSTSRTWARSRRAGPRRAALLQRAALQRRREARRRRRAVQRAVPRGRRRPRRPLHLPPRRRPLPDGHERRQPRARTSPGSRAHADGFDVESTTGSTTTRCSPSRARGARDRRRRSPTAPLPARLHASRAARSPAREALVCGTGYTGEDGVELLLRARGRRPRSGTQLVAPRRRARPASARATRCASRSASTSTATT